MSQVLHTFITNLILIKDFFFFLKIMASRMATSYRPETTQMNKELTLESSLDLTLTQHPRDENPKP
jgi:hypothetical protein